MNILNGSISLIIAVFVSFESIIGPTWDPEQKRHVELVEVLGGKFEPSPFTTSRDHFVWMKCMSASCADWVLAAVFGFINEFDSRTYLDESKIAGLRNWQRDHLRPARSSRAVTLWRLTAS